MDFDDHKGFAKQIKKVTGKTLIIGSKVYPNNRDRRRLYSDSIGLDMLPGEGVDIVHNLEDPLSSMVDMACFQFDHVDCCSVLEHVRRPWLMAENIEKLLKPGGSIIISVPFSWRVHGYPSDYWRMSLEALEIIFPSIAWEGRHYIIKDRPANTVAILHQDEAQWIQRSEAAGFGRKL